MSASGPGQGRFRAILCPIDFSRHARTALRYAAAMAAQSRGRVTVLFVNDPLLNAAAAAAAYDVGAIATTSEAELRRFVAKSIPPKTAHSIRYLVVTGTPAAVIASTARRLGSDLIVMGTQGLSGVKRLFFGSTTDGVLRRASIPVLAVPTPSGRAHRASR